MKIFELKTSEGYVFKLLIELLSNNIKTGCFIIDETGITLRSIDTYKKILIDISLPHDKFNVYKFVSPNKLYVGLNMGHLHKMLKTIKKKDSINIIIEDTDPTELIIKMIPKDHNRLSTSYIKIQTIQNIDIDKPTTDKKPSIVLSNELQKTIKDLSNLGGIINIESINTQIKLSCSNGVLKREILFGDNDSSSGEQIVTNRTYSTEQLSRITKICGLSSSVQMYTSNTAPLIIKSNIGNIGNISVFIKSNEQIEVESCMTIEVDDDSESD